MKTLAINICLIPEEKVYKLSEKLNKFDIGDYNKNTFKYIPHATLVQKSVDKNNLKFLIEKIKKLEIGKINCKKLNYYFKESHGSGWNGLNIEKNIKIKKLQEDILEITKNIKNKPRNKESYVISDLFFENLEIEIMNEDYFRDKENLHITFGKNDIKDEFEKEIFPNEIIFEKIMIGQMGNFGSVRKNLFSKDL